MVRESNAAVLDYLEHLIEEGRATIHQVTESIPVAPFAAKGPENMAASSAANIERIIVARFEQCMRSLEPAKLTNLYVQREVYPFGLVVALATDHVVRMFITVYGDAYAQEALASAKDAQRRQIEEALIGQVFAWLCPIWPFC